MNLKGVFIFFFIRKYSLITIKTCLNYLRALNGLWIYDQ